MDNNILLFSMDTFDDLMDLINDLFTTSEDYFNRWFAYDVTRNHLRYYREYRRYNIQFMNNKRGPRWTLYSDVMEVIDGLVDDGRIKETAFDGYHDDRMYVDNDFLGLVGYFDEQGFDIETLRHRNRKLEYLDAHIASPMDNNRPILFNTSFYPRLVHLHLSVTKGIHNVNMTGSSIKYFSINYDSEHRTYYLPEVKLKATGVTLDYLQIYFGGKMRVGYRRKYITSIKPLLNNLIKYVDVTMIESGVSDSLNDILGHHDSNTFLRYLEHLGYSDSRCESMRFVGPYTISGIADDIEHLHRLISLSISLVGNHVPILEKISDRLMYLELNFIESEGLPKPSPVTHLDNIKILHVTYDDIFMRNVDSVARWDIPDDISLISIYNIYAVESPDEFDADRFKNLKYLMTSFYKTIEPSSIPKGVIRSVTNHPYIESIIAKDLDYIPVWIRSDRLRDTDTARLTSLIGEIYDYGHYNSIAFLKNIIHDRLRTHMTDLV